MARVIERLSAKAVAAATHPGKRARPVYIGDGAGLYLQISKGGAKSWVLKFTLRGRAREMGLGSAGEPPAAVSLAGARDAAAEARGLLRQGIDPIQHRRAAKAAVVASELRSFQDVAAAYIAAHEAGWRNAKHKAQWASTLEQYAYPELGSLAVAALDTGAVMRVLEPIWRVKPETASRVRGRVEAVLDYATARGWRMGENPARWRGHLQNLLPARSKVARVQHHPALHWHQIAAFMKDLSSQEGVAALALRFTILTAARSGEVRGARWCEVDLHAGIWIVPANRMKAGREHRVPLSDGALEVLQKAAKLRDGDAADALVFPGARKGKPLSDMSLTAVLRRMKRDALTVHGFRSTFRDWAAESTAYSREVAEAALAHTLSDKTEAAYRRGDLFEKRKRMMLEWAAFCSRPASQAGNVTAIRASVEAA